MEPSFVASINLIEQSIEQVRKELDDWYAWPRSDWAKRPQYIREAERRLEELYDLRFKATERLRVRSRDNYLRVQQEEG